MEEEVHLALIVSDGGPSRLRLYQTAGELEMPWTALADLLDLVQFPPAHRPRCVEAFKLFSPHSFRTANDCETVVSWTLASEVIDFSLEEKFAAEAKVQEWRDAVWCFLFDRAAGETGSEKQQEMQKACDRTIEKMKAGAYQRPCDKRLS